LTDVGDQARGVKRPRLVLVEDAPGAAEAPLAPRSTARRPRVRLRRTGRPAATASASSRPIHRRADCMPRAKRSPLDGAAIAGARAGQVERRAVDPRRLLRRRRGGSGPRNSS